jgi:hypothetical protein
MNVKGRIRITVLLAAALTWFVCGAAAAGEEVSIRLQVESRTVYMGESFLVQISVDGTDEAEQPDLSQVRDFTIEYLGGQNNSSQSISIINGKLERVVQRGFVFSYRFTPAKVGILAIPQVPVKVGGKTYRTTPVTIEVTKPGETDDFKLRINLSRETCYVGEPVTLEVTWYLRKDVQDFRFTAPFLQNPDFDFAVPDVQMDNSQRYYRIPIGGGEVIAEKGRGMLGGVTYATLEFGIVLIPRRGGSFSIPEFVVACEATSGRVSRRDFFDDFFRDDFFSFRRGDIEKSVVPSNSLSLLVKDLPAEGRPPGFTGHVGEYRITASAEPTEANIGDPITLTITLEGPEYLERVELPPLQGQTELARDFKIPDERADGRIDGRKKIFTQTIRARSEDVTEIPPIRLSYFDTKEERYRMAATDPISIEVNPTRVVTASDAEGIEDAPAGAPIERWTEGIAYNFEGRSVLEPQELGIKSIVGRPSWIAAVAVPPTLYFALLAGLLLVRRSRRDPEARRARGAFRRLVRELREALEVSSRGGDFHEKALDAFRAYLGDKMGRPGVTLTALDVEREFGTRNVPGDVTGNILEIIHALEAGTYAGSTYGPADPDSMMKRISEAAKRLERTL